jgi:hypothetical protein
MAKAHFKWPLSFKLNRNKKVSVITAAAKPIKTHGSAETTEHDINGQST